MKKRLDRKDGIVDPDGVPFRVRLDLINEGDSIFIPCLNTDRATTQIQYIASVNYMRFKCRVVIENGKYGIRAWRTL